MVCQRVDVKGVGASFVARSRSPPKCLLRTNPISKPPSTPIFVRTRSFFLSGSSRYLEYLWGHCGVTSLIPSACQLSNQTVSFNGTRTLITTRVNGLFVSAAIGAGDFLGLPLIYSFLIKLLLRRPVSLEHERFVYNKVPFQFIRTETMVQKFDDLPPSAFKAQSDRKGPFFKSEDDPRNKT